MFLFKALILFIWLLIMVFLKAQHWVFCAFINDLPKTCSQSFIHLYADDTVIYSSHSDISYIKSSLQSEFYSILDWFYKNKLLSCSMVFIKRCVCSHSFDLNISFDDGSPLTKVDLFKCLGLWLDPELSFSLTLILFSKKSYGCLCSLYGPTY